VPEMMRCRTCGYVEDARRFRDTCPACGAARKSLEAWKDPLGRGRRALLALDLHPVIDHFSVSFAAAALVLSLVDLIFPGLFGPTATGMLRAFVVVLPFAVLGSFITGLIDARARFRGISGRALRRKIVIGCIFLCASAAAAVLLVVMGPDQAWVREACTVLMAVCVVCSAVLGRAGSALARAAMPD
jgi:hypothetical protein